MKNCPKCGQARQGELFKCPSCDVFYSQIDEILYEEQLLLEKHTVKGLIKKVLAAPDRSQALRSELSSIWKNTPWQTKISLWTIFAFVFALIVTVL
ncbi:hypothetical protein KEF85_15335 [Methylomonas paludis]|uniref:Uncharacterized protein n=1 Tax=Methylomonas paludis TaxID=1173101 RepID=A0A975MMN0_9GAMM|nr:hypothetical protein [Methylomonas paludis]QWF70673.1 hypothetical protein KEF85_15335 [Methylomonas paludis]